ncbi:MAG TPA: hypothetical protein VKA46_00395, partial [Gemmataceae bacterium]|nr:hypothetical protein [Gemmataceae bacterium]
NDSVSPDPGGDQLPGNAVAGPNTRHVENADYSRDDFATLTTADAALVRLRRTNEAATTTRSVRPPLPYVFARGTASNLDAWASGASVRAAAIAATRIHQVDASGMPVLDANGNPVRQEVGRANSVGKHVFAPATGTGPANFWRPGVMPFTINSDKWDDDTLLPVDTPVTVAIKAGSLTVGTAQTIIGSSGVAATSFGQPPAALTDYDLPTLAARLPTAEPPLLLSGYVPIVAVTGASSGNVIGFGFLDIDPTSVTSTSFTMTKRDGQVASSNASVALTAPLPAGTDVGDLMTQHMDPITGFKHSLLVPVLVRSMGPAR